jgi:curved DNA-binding protein
MEFIDYYKILNIEKNATEDDIKKAYRKLARQLHPDLNPNDKDAQRKFQQINEANEVLSDPEKRKKYDQYGKDWQHAEQFEQQRNARSGSSTGEQGFYGASDSDFSSFFESLFGSAGGRRKTGFRGADYQAGLHLNLTDVLETTKQTLTVNGKNIRITIPAGVENGQVIRLKGYGAPGVNGGPDGDLFITFHIKPHPHFIRKGNDLYTNRNLDLFTAVLGGEIILDTLNSKIKLKVPAATQQGTKIRLKGKGLPVYKQEGAFGDLFVTYHIQIPTELSEEQRILFTKLSELK